MQIRTKRDLGKTICDGEGGTADDKIIGSRVESNEFFVGRGAPDDYADYESFQGNDGMDETYSHDVFAPHGRKRSRSL